MGRRRAGKYCKKTNKDWRRFVPAGIAVAAIVVGVIILAVIGMPGRSVYRQLRADGYSGTQEQWLASLVGEEAAAADRTAYELACENGYKESYSVWMKTLTGVKTEDTQKTPYTVVCENGFEGTLDQWLTRIAEDPDTLGRSDGAQEQSEYEQACEYGYTGSFVQWLVSVAFDRVFQ